MTQYFCLLFPNCTVLIVCTPSPISYVLYILLLLVLSFFCVILYQSRFQVFLCYSSHLIYYMLGLNSLWPLSLTYGFSHFPFPCPELLYILLFQNSHFAFKCSLMLLLINQSYVFQVYFYGILLSCEKCVAGSPLVRNSYLYPTSLSCCCSFFFAYTILPGLIFFWLIPSYFSIVFCLSSYHVSIYCFVHRIHIFIDSILHKIIQTSKTRVWLGCFLIFSFL